ncbi:hypothetical protein BJ138DRAFT_1108734 [Hygrophoropsis aurantiaca]|uniref:Uncharacterized protein n=1 Tax=Hygrophoropsis aurantiaca TaxID=72124 RepID=A0ACB8AUD3_9AGAM|nr:hypothetical protein BJ138DRAFT_1108734 [Hygrophoropsis aurantiaca]
MPQNPQTRAWGTRFDSLLGSPPISPMAEADSPQREGGTSATSDFLTENYPKRLHDKVVHDASIFVGSLPSNIDHLELTRMLSDHLSGHSEVQTVKVIRDSKGGTCAFIQCQDAASAASLIRNLHSLPPRQFLGRCLRYEPARAFRTLLISYRTPKQYHPSSMPEDRFDPNRSDGFTLELPTSMRIWRQPGVKHLSILYNAEACIAAENQGFQLEDDPELEGTGLHLHPLICDEESLSKITEIFGPIEHFRPYRNTGSDSNASLVQVFPPPHNDPRSEGMEGGCWEVKWLHRDDCVSALMTLRRVPHLTVTWAHQPGPSDNDSSRHGMQRQHPTGRFAYPPRAQGTMDWDGNRILRSTSSHLSFSAFSPRLSGDSISINQKLATESTGPCLFEGPSEAHNRSPFAAEWSPQDSFASNAKNGPRSRPRALSLNHGQTSRAGPLPMGGRWSKKCFSTAGDSMQNKEPENRLWSDRMASEDQRHEGVTSLPSPEASISKYGHSPVSASQYVASEAGIAPTYDDDAQEVDVEIPPTPEFGPSLLTPKTPGSLMLRTPTTGSYIGDFNAASLQEFDGKQSYHNYEKQDGSLLDPTTIFVGGLEMFGPNAWDEDRVRDLFSKYGGVETVKVIRPMNKRSAFAFVKFNNEESSIRAVREEHNRILDGRPIRVQLRDCHPPQRTAWRSFRGRGRYPNVGVVHSRPGRPYEGNEEFRVDASLQKPVVISAEGPPSEFGPSSNTEEITTSLQDLTIQNVAGGEATFAKTSVETTEVSPSIQTNADTNANETPQISPPQETSWPKIVSPSASIAPSSSYTSTSSASTPGVAYPVPTMGYYHPQGWVPGFPQQFPYPMPFMGGYPGFPFPPQSGNQAYAQGNGLGASASGTPSATPVPFPPPGMYTPFIPYPPYPLKPPANHDSTQAHTQGPASSPQAPLIPTGFIQGNQGMLVAVYPPDALNQYMSGVGEQHTVTPGTPQTPAPPVWRPFPLATPGYQSIVAIPPVSGASLQQYPQTGRASGREQGWSPSPSPGGGPGPTNSYFAGPHPHSRQPFPSASHNGPTSFGHGSTFEPRYVPPRRQFRRDNQHYHKNNNPRGNGYQRYPRGGYSLNSPSGPGTYNEHPHHETNVETGWTR